MKKTIFALMLSAALLGFSSTAEATTQGKPNFFEQVFKKKTVSSTTKKKKVVANKGKKKKVVRKTKSSRKVVKAPPVNKCVINSAHNDRCVLTKPYAYNNTNKYVVTRQKKKNVPVKTNSSVLNTANRWVGYNETMGRHKLKVYMGIDPKRIPWCAGFVNAVLEQTGRKSTGQLTAASYLKYGRRTFNPSPGDIVVLKRNNRGGKHVGFYVATVYDKGQKYIKVLGGNQNSAVNYKLYPAHRIIQYRTTTTMLASL